MVALEFKIFQDAEVENHSERLECFFHLLFWVSYAVCEKMVNYAKSLGIVSLDEDIRRS